MIGYIYLTVNKINNKKYIGKRQKSYFDTNYKGSGKLLKKAIKKYGWENFICTPIQWCKTKEELNEAEKYWINKYDAINNKDYYNLADGGHGGYTWRPYGELNPMYGTHPSEETKNKTCHFGNQFAKGRKHTEEAKEKLREQRIGGNNPRAKKVRCIEKNLIFECVKYAQDWLGKPGAKIKNACLTGAQSCGYHWEYLD